jgi:branched-chain amino acid transport system substrate-binding protein
MMALRLAALAALVLIAACENPSSNGSAPAGPAIEIASEFPLRGDLTFPELDRAVDIAITEHPSVDGYRLVHLTLDDSLGGVWDTDRALQNMRRAVRESAIAGVIGPLTSDQATVLIPLGSDSNLVVLSPSNTADCLTDQAESCLVTPRAQATSTNYFRVAAPDTLIARAAADLAVRRLGASTFAVLTDPLGGLFAQPMSDAFSDEAAKLGGHVVFKQNFFPLETNFAPMLREARAAGAQSLYVSTGNDPACSIRSQMQGIFPPDAYLISGDRLADAGCIEDANLTSRTDDHFVLTIAARQPASIPSDLTDLKRGVGYPVYTFAAYDCARILIDAIDRAIRANGGKIPTREQVREAVAATSSFKGLTGTYTFKANGDVADPGFSFYTVKQGDWAFWRSP